jgi:hypothetical protein
MTFRALLTAYAMVLALTPLAAGKTAAQASQQNTFFETLERSIVQTTGAQENTVETMIKGNILIVSRVNSNMNEATHAGRNNEASAIASVVSKAIADKPEYKNIHTISVQYVSRDSSGSGRKVVDVVDFRKGPSGTFQLHTT